MSLLALLLPAIFADSMALQQNAVVPVWGKAEPGTTITLTTSWDEQRLHSVAADDSTFRFEVKTPAYAQIPYGDITLQESKHQPLTLHHILFAEVWLAGGQSNMEMPMRGFLGQPVEGAYEAILHSGEGYPVRFFFTPRQLANRPIFEGKGRWYTASPNTTHRASAIGYLFARELSRAIGAPVAIVESTWGGTRVQPWMPEEQYVQTRCSDEKDYRAQLAELSYQAGAELNACPIPTSMYNAMIHPIAGFAIRGLLWYQGETNIYFHPETYSRCFSAMVEGWRKVWNRGDWPVYFVQIAPFYYGEGTTAALLREQQDKALGLIPNSQMVVTLDIGDSACIHPVNKLAVAQRLTGLALRGVYGHTSLWAQSPRLEKAVAEGSKVQLFFDDAPLWIYARGKVRDLEIAGEDGVFYPAAYELTHRKMIVWSEYVAEPHSVRYAYRNYTQGTLFSTVNGLPVAPFEVMW